MTMIRARRQERTSLLEPKNKPKTEQTSFKSISVVTTYTPEKNILGDIVKK